MPHRLVRSLQIRPLDYRILRAAQVSLGLACEFLDGVAGIGRQQPGGQQLQVAVVAVVVLGDDAGHPCVVALHHGLPGLAPAQRRVRGGLAGDVGQLEAHLDRHRLLAPQGAVVVEHGDAGVGRHVVRSTLARDSSDEVHD
jgi:hypothetical protein